MLLYCLFILLKENDIETNLQCQKTSIQNHNAKNVPTTPKSRTPNTKINSILVLGGLPVAFRPDTKKFKYYLFSHYRIQSVPMVRLPSTTSRLLQST